MYSLDALFGLPRKRAAGVSLRPPLHGNLFFCDQDAVDQYVAEKDEMKQCFQVIMHSMCETDMHTFVCMYESGL